MGTRATRDTDDADRHHHDIDRIVDAAVSSSSGPPGRPRTPQAELVEVLRHRREEASHAVASALVTAVAAAWHQHWQPADLPRALARVCGQAHARLAAEAILHQTRSYDTAELPPRWQAQLDAIDPGTGPLPVGGADDSSWALPPHPREDRATERVVVAVETLAFLRSVPRLPKIGPPPGEVPGRAARAGRGRPHPDPGVLHRVSSLLAKAESTTFPDEAESLTAKAQQLMARHAIDWALVEASRTDGSAPTVTARRLGVDDPYASARAVLLQTVADANRCRSVWSKDFGFATVFGSDTDLDTVELLHSSLLVQSARAMIAASPPGRSAPGQTRSFRQSFLVSFAHRIGDRLREAVAQAVDDTAGDHKAGALPVLADRAEAADAACRAAFPDLKTSRTAANSMAGWQAGRRAADRAQLDLNNGIEPGTEPVLGLALQGRSN